MRKWEGWGVLQQGKLETRMVSAEVCPFREQGGFQRLSQDL